MPEKKVINVKLVKGKRRARGTAKPKSKTKQKQKQRQTVNVQVSSGGSGGGTSFIPMPQAPAFDYSLLASLIRPANTVDMPMRTMAPIPEPVQVRPAEQPTLAGAKTGGKAMTEAEKEVKARARLSGETDEQYNMRIVKYEQQLANKRLRERQNTFERQKEKVLSKLPMSEAQPIQGGAPTFIGNENVFALGEK